MPCWSQRNEDEGKPRAAGQEGTIFPSPQLIQEGRMADVGRIASPGSRIYSFSRLNSLASWPHSPSKDVLFLFPPGLLYSTTGL